MRLGFSGTRWSWMSTFSHLPVSAGMSEMYTTMPGMRSSLKTRGRTLLALLTMRVNTCSR